MVDKSKYPHECELIEKWSRAGLANDPRNHCVPLLDVLQSPLNSDMIILVLPMLRPFNKPRSETYGEAIDFFQQALIIAYGLQFMHEHGVAHHDFTGRNVMMDPTDMFPNGFHHEYDRYKADLTTKAKPFTRTPPPKYYIINFGVSRQYDPSNKNTLEEVVFGADDTVPEHQGQLACQPCNPYATDVYYVGNMVKRYLMDGDPRDITIEEYKGFEFMRPLVDSMTQSDPSKRPTIQEVVTTFEEIRNLLGWRKLRSRPPRRHEGSMTLGRWFHHWRRRIFFIVTLTPAIPQQKVL
ncbi:hypothetical protein AX16_010892 [Volvariella volvacea WC 439]|nr:hypothetical protein AX16_010892 [Volvariella volvacea WC 439]